MHSNNYRIDMAIKHNLWSKIISVILVKKLSFIELQTLTSYNRIFKTKINIRPMSVCEVSANLTQYIGDKQRVLKMLFTYDNITNL